MATKYTDIPISLENDARCCCYGELMNKYDNHVKNSIFVLTEYRVLQPMSKSKKNLSIGLGIIMDGKIVTATNNAGGILGGITNGMPVIFSAAFKATPSVGCSQSSVSLRRMEETTLNIKGRHDPCIVPRAVPVVEAAAAIAIYDLVLGNTQTERRK